MLMAKRELYYFGNEYDVDFASTALIPLPIVSI